MQLNQSVFTYNLSQESVAENLEDDTEESKCKTVLWYFGWGFEANVYFYCSEQFDSFKKITVFLTTLTGNIISSEYRLLLTRCSRGCFINTSVIKCARSLTKGLFTNYVSQK